MPRIKKVTWRHNRTVSLAELSSGQCLGHRGGSSENCGCMTALVPSIYLFIASPSLLLLLRDSQGDYLLKVLKSAWRHDATPPRVYASQRKSNPSVPIST
uniref:Uncharacterized protein n=1 Tax=Steinernema glaseri TaxID=37863 RepID=A0A1I7Z5Y6_9BILA